MELELKEMLYVAKLRMATIQDIALEDDVFNDEHQELEKLCSILHNLIKLEKHKVDGEPYSLIKLKRDMSPESIIGKHLRQIRQKRQAQKETKGSNEKDTYGITDALNDYTGKGDITIVY